MTEVIDLRSDLAQAGGTARYEVDLSHRDGSARHRIFYEMPADPALPGEGAFDAALCAALPYAMSAGAALRVHGPVSRETLANLHEYQMVWARWRPDRYRRVEIEPDAVVDPASVSREAISAFSGGVDATFTILENARLSEAPHAERIGAGLLVHGFDIALDNRPAFDTVLANAERFLGRYGIEARWIRTNSRELGLLRWRDSFAAQLAACLQMHSFRYGRALIGSASPYDDLLIPWGSTPVTDHLLSSARMRIIHYGAGYSRSEKIERLAEHPDAVASLRVCWQGQDQSRNCGECEKCVRTKMNLKACGIDDPACFAHPLTEREILGIRLGSKTELVELKRIVAFCEARGIDGPWVQALRRRVARGLRPPLRSRIGAGLGRLGLLGVARRGAAALRIRP